MPRLSSEAKVGIFVFIGMIILAYMSTRVGNFKFGGQGGYELCVFFDSAAGLARDAAVEIAGVEVGTVRSIALERGKARLVLAIQNGIEVGSDVQAAIRTKGMLGDKYLEIILGSDTAVPLKDGDEIANTVSAADVDRLLNQLSEIGEDVKTVSGSFAGTLGGEEGRRSLQVIVNNLRELTISLNNTLRDNNEKINEMIANLTQFSRDLKEAGSSNKENLNEIIGSVKETSVHLEDTIVALKEIVTRINKGEGTVGKLINEDETVNNLNESLGSLKEISDKINRGEGTVGKLINEDETIENLNTTLTSINDYLQKQDTFRTFMNYRGEYLFGCEDTKSYLSIGIQPKEDKYYLFEVIDDPAGKKTSKTTKTTVDGVTTVTEEEKTDHDALKFSAQIAKRYYDLTLRGGIMESTGGFGLDYSFLKDRLVFSFDAFDFDPDENPHLKFRAELFPIHHCYIAGGFDDFISNEGNETAFLGAGIRFSDEDIKGILSTVRISLGQ